MKKLLFLPFIFGIMIFASCEQNIIEPEACKTIVLDEKSAELVKAGNEFGLELFQEIYTDETEADNIMVSPLSVSIALAMTYNGANGETKTALEKTLKVYGLSPAEINQSYKNLVSALKSVDPKVIFEIANAIYYRQGFHIENDFITTNKNYYNAEIDALDFSSHNAVKTINNWVADKTSDKIESIIKQITPDNVMFLLNAIYFKGIWQKEFNKKDTKELPFFKEENNTIDVPVMQKTEAVSYIANSLFSAVKLPYGAGNYSMYVFLPQTGNSLQDIVNQLSQTNWNMWLNNFGDTVTVDIKIPILKYEYEIKLNDVLSNMGMGIAFGGNADFTGMNKTGGLYIDYVKHKTFIEVNEEGTEAAAVTAVAVNRLSAGPQNIQFNVNRPFFYAITEKDTDAILFMGTVTNPQTN